jgi:hypothetical protein
VRTDSRENLYATVAICSTDMNLIKMMSPYIFISSFPILKVTKIRQKLYSKYDKEMLTNTNHGCEMFKKQENKNMDLRLNWRRNVRKRCLKETHMNRLQWFKHVKIVISIVTKPWAR